MLGDVTINLCSGGYKVTRNPTGVAVFVCILSVVVAGQLGAEPGIAISAVQPTSTSAFHRSGQTFLTWQENSTVTHESYVIYRHTEPINASNLSDARRVATVAEGSSIYHTERSRAGDYPAETNGGYASLRNYVIQPLGAQLSDTTGLFVWTTKANENAYYAVTTLASGSENTSDFAVGNTAGPVSETVEDPSPIMIWRSAENYGCVYTQFMDYENWNPTYETPEGQTYAYNYFVGFPAPGVCEQGIPASWALILHVEGYGSRYEIAEGSHYYCAVELWCDDPRQSWYYGYSATHDYTDPEAAVTTGPIVNFTEERLQRAVYDVLRDPDFSNVDPKRVYCYGHSMGGSGALALAMRYPNVFAAVYCSEPMTNYGACVLWHEDFIPKWGAIETNLPVENRGVFASHLAKYNATGVYDWQNHQLQLVQRKADEMAHVSLGHGTEDDVITWADQGLLAYEPFNQGRRAFSGEIVQDGHTWIGYSGMGPTVGDTYDASPGGPFFGLNVVRDETLPALTYASGSLPVPPTGVGGYNMNLEWSASWNPWAGAPTDTATRWEIALRSLQGDQAVDVTPRRCQEFTAIAGQPYVWERRDLSGALLDSGSVVADSSGLVTVTSVPVTTQGIRLRIEPSGDLPTATITPTPVPISPTDTSTHTPTALASTNTPTPEIPTNTPTDSPLPSTATPTNTLYPSDKPVIGLNISLPSGVTDSAPITVGVPVPDLIYTEDSYTVMDSSGTVPSQIKATSRTHPNNRISWLLVDFQAQPGESYRIEVSSQPTPTTAVSLSGDISTGLTVDTGAGTFQILPSSDFLGQVSNALGAPLIESASWGVTAVPATLRIVDSGPLRASVEVRAEQAVHGLDLTARLHFYAGKPYCRVRLTLTNHNPAVWGTNSAYDNGECEVVATQPVVQGLMSPNTLAFDDITWSLDLTADVSGTEILYQDSSGTDNWDFYAGRAPRMQSGVVRRGYTRTVNGSETDSGNFADGVITAAGVRLDVPWFGELFPKALRSREGCLEFGIFPGEFSIDHRLRAGEQKTHDVWISLDPSIRPPWDARAMPDFSTIHSTRGLGLVGPRHEGRYFDYEDYLDAQFDPTREHRDGFSDSLDAAQIDWDLFGYLDYGDMPLDFENGAPNNLKYDVGLAFIHQAFRINTESWWRWAETSNRHFADVDIFHSTVEGYTVDRNWFQGGSWGHSLHDETGITNPHRNCNNPNIDLTYGVCGLVAWTLLTGDEVCHSSAIEMAENILWRVRNSTDFPCVSQAWGGGNGTGYAIDGLRAAANAVRALVWGWRLTGDAEFLTAAGQGADWYVCEQDNFTCASWQDALFGRALGEYVMAARDAGVAVNANSVPAFEHLMQNMAAHITIQGDRAWFSGCTGTEINAWMLLAADVFALGYAATEDRQWLDDYAVRCFNTGSRDPFYEGDIREYHSTKEFINASANGTIFLYFITLDEPTPTPTALLDTPTTTPTPSAEPTETPTWGTILLMDGNKDGVVDEKDLLLLMKEWHRQ